MSIFYICVKTKMDDDNYKRENQDYETLLLRFNFHMGKKRFNVFTGELGKCENEPSIDSIQVVLEDSSFQSGHCCE